MSKPQESGADTPYSLLGGDSGVRRLVDTFYDLMDEVPEYYVIRKLHAADLAGSREKLYLFLSGWPGPVNHHFMSATATTGLQG